MPLVLFSSTGSNTSTHTHIELLTLRFNRLLGFSNDADASCRYSRRCRTRVGYLGTMSTNTTLLLFFLLQIRHADQLERKFHLIGVFFIKSDLFNFFLTLLFYIFKLFINFKSIIYLINHFNFKFLL